MTFTTSEVTDAIEEFGLQEFVEAVTENWGGSDQKADLPDLGEATYVDSKLGEEGGGEDIWFVFKLDEVFYMVNGYYTSFDGSNWEDSSVQVVVPKQKTITVYERP